MNALIATVSSLALSAFVATASVAQTTPSTPSPSPANPSPPVPAIPPAPSLFIPSQNTGPFRNEGIYPNNAFPQSVYFQNSYQQAQLYSRCLSRIAEKRSRALLDADPQSADERNAVRLLYGLGRPCLPYGYAPPRIFVRGGLAEAMYHNEIDAGVNVDHRATPAETIAFYAAERERSGARLIDDRVYTAWANCVVVSAPRAVRAVLDRKHGSTEERAALDEAVREAPTCVSTARLPAAGATTFLRAYLAESAYRWVRFQG